jgi:tetratricopeptide (TPR) repeat protein
MRYVTLTLGLTALVVLGGCAPSFYGQGRKLAQTGANAEAVPLFYREIEANPASGRAWRELGVSFYEQGEYGKAEESLKRAAALGADARTHLYLGLVYEQQGDPERALRAYRMALGLAAGGKTRGLIESRVQFLQHEQVMREVQTALAAERNLATADIPDNTVAVVEFDSSEMPPELAPLAKGLAEFTAQDLGKVGSLRVVDRLKLDAIRKELELSRSELADPATAPRIGRLVGGRRLVTGTLLGLGDDGFRLSGAVVNTADESVTAPEHADGTLADFFRVQKQFVFDIIKSMDITLTPAERSAIEEVPTENFLAFMAYCRGLSYRDGNQLDAARAEFKNAAHIDGHFAQAASQGNSLTAIIAAGPGGGLGDVAKFSPLAAAESNIDLGSGEVGTFEATVAGWNGFIPTDVDLFLFGQFVDSPLRTRQQGSAVVTVRGNLDARP